MLKRNASSNTLQKYFSLLTQFCSSPPPTSIHSNFPSSPPPALVCVGECLWAVSAEECCKTLPLCLFISTTSPLHVFSLPAFQLMSEWVEIVRAEHFSTLENGPKESGQEKESPCDFSFDDISNAFIPILNVYIALHVTMPVDALWPSAHSQRSIINTNNIQLQ